MYSRDFFFRFSTGKGQRRKNQSSKRNIFWEEMASVIPGDEISNMQERAHEIVGLWNGYGLVAADSSVFVLSAWMGQILRRFLGWTLHSTLRWAAEAVSLMKPKCLAAQACDPDALPSKTILGGSVETVRVILGLSHIDALLVWRSARADCELVPTVLHMKSCTTVRYIKNEFFSDRHDHRITMSPACDVMTCHGTARFTLEIMNDIQGQICNVVLRVCVGGCLMEPEPTTLLMRVAPGVGVGVEVPVTKLMMEYKKTLIGLIIWFVNTWVEEQLGFPSLLRIWEFMGRHHDWNPMVVDEVRTVQHGTDVLCWKPNLRIVWTALGLEVLRVMKILKRWETLFFPADDMKAVGTEVLRVRSRWERLFFRAADMTAIGLEVLRVRTIINLWGQLTAVGLEVLRVRKIIKRWVRLYKRMKGFACTSRGMGEGLKYRLKMAYWGRRWRRMLRELVPGWWLKQGLGWRLRKWKKMLLARLTRRWLKDLEDY